MKSKWISCDIKPLILPHNFVDGCITTDRVLTWHKTEGYRFCFWLCPDGWCDSDDAMSPFNIQPTHWLPLDLITNDWMECKNPEEATPKKDGYYLVWYPKLADYVKFVLFKYENGQWLIDNFGEWIPTPDHYKPHLWMELPEPPKGK